MKKQFFKSSSIVALRTFVSAFASNELLPKRRFFIKAGSPRSREIVINIFYGAQESTFYSSIRGTVKKTVPR